MSLRDLWDPDHDLDRTPLPAGHEQYMADQQHFDELWQKCRDGAATLEERAEMLRMQEEYWSDA